MGFSTQEYWSGLPCLPPGDFPERGIEPTSLVSPALAGRFLPLAPPEKPNYIVCYAKYSWRRKWQPTPVFLPGESHGQRSLVGYSPRGRKESEWLSDFTFTFMPNIMYHINWTTAEVRNARNLHEVEKSHMTYIGLSYLPFHISRFKQPWAHAVLQYLSLKEIHAVQTHVVPGSTVLYFMYIYSMYYVY